MADWLVEQSVTLAAMESTATYWKPVFYALEDRMDVWMLNAAPHEGGAGGQVRCAGARSGSRSWSSTDLAGGATHCRDEGAFTSEPGIAD